MNMNLISYPDTKGEKKVSQKTAVLISCFDYYDIRIRYIQNLLECEGYKTQYVIAGFDHYTKELKTTRKGTRLICVPKYRRNLSITRLLSHYKFSRGVYRLLVEEQPRLVYSMIPPNSLVKQIVRYKRKFDCKIVFDIYDDWPDSLLIKNVWLKLITTPLFNYWRNLRDKHIDNADGIIYVSRYSKGKYNKVVGHIKSAILYPLPGLGEKPCYSGDENELVFCYVGGINKLLNITRIVDLLSAISKTKKVKVHIIGKGEKTEAFIKALGCNGIKTIYHGAVFDWNKKLQIYQSCAFGLNIPKVEYLITMPMKLSEYLCAGLPVVNEALEDSEQLISEYLAGINTQDMTIEEAAQLIISLTQQEIRTMHDNAAKLYEVEFVKKVTSIFLTSVLS